MASPMRVRRGPYWRLRLLGLTLLIAVLCVVAIRKLDPIIFQLRLRTVEATFGIEETHLDAQGLVFRREQVVHAPAPGRLTLLVGEGRRVRAGDVIAEVNNSGEMEELPARVDDVNRRLNQARASFESRRDTLERRVRSLEESLAEADRVMRQALSAGNDAEANAAAKRRDALREELAQVQSERANLVDQFESNQRDLIAQREAALRLRPSDVAFVVSPTSGVVSFALDGLEDVQPGTVLTKVTELSPTEPERVQDGLKVERGAPLFRLVDATAPVEVVISARASTMFEPGTSLDVTFHHLPEQHFTGRLTEAVQVNREWFGRVELASPDPSLVHRREVRMSLIANRAQGVVVPARAVVEREDRPGVYVMLGDRPVFRMVRLLGGNERRVVIDAPDGVPVGASVVVNPALVLKRHGQR